jgi:hypothetical protein
MRGCIQLLAWHSSLSTASQQQSVQNAEDTQWGPVQMMQAWLGGVAACVSRVAAAAEPQQQEPQHEQGSGICLALHASTPGHSAYSSSSSSSSSSRCSGEKESRMWVLLALVLHLVLLFLHVAYIPADQSFCALPTKMHVDC